MSETEDYWLFVPAGAEFNSILGRGDEKGFWCNVNDPYVHQFTDSDSALFVTCGACPFPSDPRNKKCNQCITKLGRKGIIFTSRVMRYSDLSFSNVITDPEKVPERWEYICGELRMSEPLVETCLHERFDIFGSKILAGKEDTVLFHACSSCKNPMNPRFKECFVCVQSGTKIAGRIPDFVVLVKMTTGKYWPPPDKDVLSIGERLIGMSIEDMERINEIIIKISHTDDSYEKVALCDRGISINDTVAVLWALKGEALYYCNELEKALFSYERAIQLVPNNEVLWCNRGFILKALGKTQFALASFEKALSLNPADADARALRDLCLATLGRDVVDEMRFYEKSCPYCGIGVPASARFCYNCGKSVTEPIPSERTCVFCRYRIPETARFCPYCGASSDVDLTRLY